jgi:hypothetical protein
VKPLLVLTGIGDPGLLDSISVFPDSTKLFSSGSCLTEPGAGILLRYGIDVLRTLDRDITGVIMRSGLGTVIFATSVRSSFCAVFEGLVGATVKEFRITDGLRGAFTAPRMTLPW